MTPSSLPSFVTAIAALSLVLALIWVGARLARAGGFAARFGGGRELAVLETVSLDSRRRVHLVRCGQRRVLLLTGGGSDVVAGWLPQEESEA
ncbi:MAG: flagellar biosynthetic protein FliO [Acetobacteraceae bacterium]|nr:flagellar biosynthetic protein FliO [Acetobacteraceae bacterium]